ncbi:MAG: PIG-L family deacetylase [Candidatus Omnitrophota bacterium]
MKKVLLSIIFLAAVFVSLGQARENVQIALLEPITAGDRILIMAPHPDDEAIACAGVIQQALKKRAAVKVLYLTNGDRNEFAFIVYEKRLVFRQGEFIHMGIKRMEESKKAMRLLGLSDKDLVFLGYPDGGTLNIFNRYWQAKKPYCDILTHISKVPYKDNLSYGSVYTGENILRDIEREIVNFKPSKIFVSHPADTNSDHRAFYLFLQVALQDLKNLLDVTPQVHPYLVHSNQWPLPRRYHPKLNLDPPNNFLNSQIAWNKLTLESGEVDKKYQAVLCYKTQTLSAAFYLLSFVRGNELFGDYPELSLSRQHSVEKRALSFLGLSGMYPASEADILDRSVDFGNDGAQASFAVCDDVLLMRIEKEGAKERLALTFRIFGYRQDILFADMPKINIFTNKNNFRIYDKWKALDSQGASLELSKGVLVMKVPLKLLGNPEFVLVSVKASGGLLPMEATSYRKIYIKEGVSDGAGIKIDQN